jgi:two-component system sensor histidine kinase/response regulator
MRSDRPTVLFVDDEPNVLDGLRRNLFGCTTQWNMIFLSTPSAALNILETENIHVVVTDQRMPEMTGLELLSHFRSIAPDTIPILLTGNTDQETAVSAINEGMAFRFYNKPCCTSSLIEGIAAAVARSDEKRNLKKFQLSLEQSLLAAAESNQKLRMHEALLTTVTDNLPSMVGYWGRDLRCGFANQAYFNWFGRTKEQMHGISIQELLGKHLFEQNRPNIEAALDGKRQFFEREIVRPNGEIGYTEAHYIPHQQNDEVLGFSIVVNDVTNSKKIELNTLEVKRQVESALAVATAATAAKSTFLANMSHEIRTPLNAIIGFTRILRRSITSPVEADRLEKIDQSAKHLLGIINDILDISKIEAGKLELSSEDFNLRAEVRSACDAVAQMARNKGIRLEVKFDPELTAHVRGDPLRIRQCLLNYLNNAVKFTEHGKVTLRVKKFGARGNGQGVRFEVEDTGVGIPTESHERLFSDFEQADGTTSRKFGGTGLGLVITKRLSLMMGGGVGFDSVPGQGSRFWFDAVLERATEAGASDTKTSEADAEEVERQLNANFSGSRILLAEDNCTNQAVVLGMLADVGLAAEVVENGALALEAVRKARYDLILMDMQMPKMDGLVATREIRRLPNGEDVPIVALTANAFAEDQRNCLDAGMNAHLAKPVLPESLYAVLLKWLKQYSPLPLSGLDEMDPTAGETAEDEEGRLRRFLGGVEHIDLDLGIKLSRRVSRYIPVLVEYAGSYDEDLSRLRDFLVSGNAAEARRIAHSIKGSSAMLGITGVQGPAAELEKAIMAGIDMTTILGLHDVVNQRYGDVSAAIRAMTVKRSAV